MVKTQKPTGIPKTSGIPMRTMVMPKGQLTVDSLDTLLGDDASMPVQSHQLPKGQLKLTQQVAGKQKTQKEQNRSTLELLKGFAETAQQRIDREKKEERDRILAKRKKINESKIGKGGTAASKSPMRAGLGQERVTNRSKFITGGADAQGPASARQQPGAPLSQRSPGVSPMNSSTNVKAIKGGGMQARPDTSPTSGIIQPTRSPARPGQLKVPPSGSPAKQASPGASPQRATGIPQVSPRRIGGGAQRMFGGNNSPTKGSPLGTRQPAGVTTGQKMFASSAAGSKIGSGAARQQSPYGVGSKIGSGARYNVSPTRKQPEAPSLDNRVSAHFGTVSPVKDDELGAKPTEEPGTEGESNTTKSTVVDQVVRPKENEETGTGQTPTWEQLKQNTLQAIKRDEQPEVFEALLADVQNFMTELVRTGQLAAISVELQEDAAVFFQRRNILSDSESKKVLQKINNILKKQQVEEPGTEGELNTTNSTVVDQVVRPEENEEAKKWLDSMDVAEEEDVIEDPLDNSLEEEENKKNENAPDLPIFTENLGKDGQEQDSHGDSDSSDGKLQSLLTDSEAVAKPSTPPNEEESSLQNLSSPDANSKRMLLTQASIITVEEQTIEVDIDLLSLVKTIKRRKKADLIDEIQRELDEIANSIETNEEIPHKVAHFEDNYNFEKFRPGLLEEWNLEIQKLDPDQKINVPQFDLDEFNQPFTTEESDLTRNSMAIDELQATKLIDELAKIQDENQKYQENALSDDDSDDLLSGMDHISQKLVKIEGDDSPDSPSNMLPVPKQLEKDIQPFVGAQNDQSSSEIISPVKFPESPDKGQEANNFSDDVTQEQSMSLMDEEETQQMLQERLEKKRTQLVSGCMDTLTEHPDQEDLMSQIYDMEERSARESIMPKKRPSRREQRENAEELLQQIMAREREDARKRRIDPRNFASSVYIPASTKNPVLTPEKNQSNHNSGFESLAVKNSRQRTQSLQGKNAEDQQNLFDSESDVFSALQVDSDSSINLGSQLDSPDRPDRQMNEKEIDDVDENFINLTNRNTEFQRLVEEAKAEKNKKAQSHLTIETEIVEEEVNIRESQEFRQSKDFAHKSNQPKPLEKPRTKSEEAKQRQELRELITYKKVEKNKGKEEEIFKDTVPRPNSLLQAKASDNTIDLNSLLSLLITDSSLKKPRTAHLYLCEDRELEKSRVGLKILYEQLVKQNEIQAAALVLLKISKVYFCLNNLSGATETVSKSVQDLSVGGFQAPPEALFWKGLIYFYHIFTKRVQQGSRKIAANKQQLVHRDLSQMINSCETSLTRVMTDRSLKVMAKFLLLKLALFVQRERFGCDLLYITQMDAMKIAQSIQHDDYYYGQIALSEVYIDGQERKTRQAFDLLKGVIKKYPRRGEAYIKLWQLNMYCGNQLKRSQTTQQLVDQRSKSLYDSVHEPGTPSIIRTGSIMSENTENMECASMHSSILDLNRQSLTSTDQENVDNAKQANKYYQDAYGVVSELLENCDENFASTPQQRLLMVFLSVKSLQKSGQYIQAFELLQREFSENPAITSLMYLFGKYVVKAMANEVHEQLNNMIQQLAGQMLSSGSSFLKSQKKKGKDFRIDQGYLGSGIGALEECLRSCFAERHAKVNYYIGFAYKVLRMPLKTQEYYVKAFSLNKKSRTLSHQQAHQVQIFLKEQSFFTIIAEECDQMIKEKQGLKKRSQQQPKLTELQLKNKLQEYIRSMQNMEKIDQANSLLMQARMQAYLIESPDSNDSYGETFERLIQEFPTFIDGYIEFWHYLKYRLTLQSKKGRIDMRKHADQIVDKSGKKLLDNMRECATSALMYSDATEVPTSLWVEARIIFAKQMIFERQIGQAISILKDICYIIPPYAIEGLSYVQYLDTIEEEQLQDLIRTTEVLNQDQELSAEEMFMRQADKVKRRNSPTRSKISKDAPMFQKKTFRQVMFDKDRANKTEEILPKGKINLNMLAAMEKDSPGLKKTQTNIQSQPAGPKGRFMGAAQEEEPDMFSQINTAEKAYRESMHSKKQLNLDVIEEEEKSEAQSESHNSVVLPQQKNQHLGDAIQMLEKIKLLSRGKNQSAVGGGNHNRQVSMLVSPGGSGANRVSMYRKQPQQRGSQYLAQSTRNGKTDRGRSLTIYNPFNFDKKMMTPKNNKMSAQVSQSLDFNAMKELNEMSADSPPQAMGGNVQNEHFELAYQAMLKAQMAWQEQNQALGEISEMTQSVYEEESVAEAPQEAIIESENFAIYSNFKFLQLIGKYCAKSKQYSDEGLKALNDYLLLLEYNRSNYTKQEYYSERAITIFYIGSIFYQMKDYFHAVEHLLPIQEQLHLSKKYKELAASEHKVSKIWRLNFNEKTIKWDYFSLSNMENFAKNEEDRQARRTLLKMQQAGSNKRKQQTKIHKLN